MNGQMRNSNIWEGKDEFRIQISNFIELDS